MKEMKVVFRGKGWERDFMPQRLMHTSLKTEPRATNTGMLSLKEKDTFRMKPDAMLC